jgi:coenzyme PQQ precursor peptide PqqA
MNEIKNVEWKKPELEEIPLSCEITSYSSAELPN